MTELRRVDNLIAGRDVELRMKWVRRARVFFELLQLKHQDTSLAHA